MSPRVHDQPAFILHKREFQESSLILELLSAEHGRLSVLAKGARKRKDRSHFEYGHRLSIGWTGQQELKTLTQIDSHAIPLGQKEYLAVFYINELLLYLLPKHDAQPSLFDRYQMFVLELSRLPPDQQGLEILLRNFEMDLLTTLGIMPSLGVDATSGESLKAETVYQVLPVDGVVKVATDTDSGYSGKALICISNRELDEPEILRAAKIILRKIIDYNLQGRTLQSRKLYQQLNQF